MFTYIDKWVVCCDVDDTLVSWDTQNDIEKVRIEDTENGLIFHLPAMKDNIQQLCSLKSTGHFIIVWSQAGSSWAKDVVNALGLQDIVDLVMSKPSYCIDDLPSYLWIGENLWHPLKGEDNDSSDKIQKT